MTKSFWIWFVLISATLKSVEGHEANSLIMNVAGKILMLQKDRPAEERAGKKVCVNLDFLVNLYFLINPYFNHFCLSYNKWKFESRTREENDRDSSPLH